jgi:aminoglycoside phosphotransferase (APT) family kinase protein
VLGATVSEFGTRLVRTRVGDLGEGRFVWERRAGEGRGAPLAEPSPAARAAVRAADAPGVRFVLPEVADGTLLYAMPGPFSAARLMHGREPALDDLLRAALHGLGAALRRLHASPAPDELPDSPPGLARLTGWLETGRDDLATAARKRLGPERWARAREWCTALREGPAAPVLIHGGASLGLLVPSPRSGVAGLVTGEDLARGAGALDVGWLLGELVELEEAARRGLGSAPDADYAGLRAALLEGYGVTEGDPSMRRVATLRVLTHAHDYATYVGWHDDLLAYLDLITELLDARPMAHDVDDLEM